MSQSDLEQLVARDRARRPGTGDRPPSATWARARRGRCQQGCGRAPLHVGDARRHARRRRQAGGPRRPRCRSPAPRRAASLGDARRAGARRASTSVTPRPVASSRPGSAESRPACRSRSPASSRGAASTRPSSTPSPASRCSRRAQECRDSARARSRSGDYARVIVSSRAVVSARQCSRPPPFAPPNGMLHQRGLPRHQLASARASARSTLGVEAHASLERPADVLVLHPVSGEVVQLPVGEPHGELDRQLAVALAQDPANRVGEPEPVGGPVEEVASAHGGRLRAIGGHGDRRPARPCGALDWRRVLPADLGRARVAPARRRRGHDGGGPAVGPPPAPEIGGAPGALRGPPGGDAGDRRAPPRLQPVPGDGPLREPAGGGRQRGEHHRDDVPARPDAVGAGTDAVARTAPPVHRPRDPYVGRGPGERGVRPDGGRRAAGATDPLGPRGNGARRCAHGVRPAPLRGQPERDDRSAVRPHRVPQQPHPEHRARPRRARLGPRPGAHGRSTCRSSAADRSRSCSRRCSSRCSCSSPSTSTGRPAGSSPCRTRRSPPSGRPWSCRPPRRARPASGSPGGRRGPWCAAARRGPSRPRG